MIRTGKTGLARRLLATMVVAGAVLALAAVPAVSVPETVGSTGADGLKEVARLAVFSPKDRVGGDKYYAADVDLVLSPARRRAYQVFGTSPVGPTIQAVNLDTLRPLGRVKGRQGYGLPAGGGNYLLEQWHVIDEKRGLLYLAVRPPSLGVVAQHEIMIFDLDALDRGSANAVVGVIRPPVEVPELQNALIKGMSLYVDKAGRQKMLVYFMRSPPPSIIVQLDVERALAAAPSGTNVGYSDWRHVLATNCGGTTLTLATSAPIFHSDRGDYVYTVCHVGKGFLGVVPAVQGSFTLGVVRIPLGVGGLPRSDQEEVFPGPSQVHAAVADPEADRISMVTETTASGFGAGQTLWTFDGRASRYVGSVGLAAGYAGQNSTYGIDQASGRIYALVPHQRLKRVSSENRFFVTPGGLQLVDSRLTPVPQALSFVELARTAQPAIRIDPPRNGKARRIFLRYAGDQEPIPGKHYDAGFGLEKCEFPYPAEGSIKETEPRDCRRAEPFYRVFEETVPIATQPPLSEQDRFTVNVVEAPGLTDSNFEASSSGYAVRIRLVGGVREGTTTVCTPDDREYTLGWVENARLSNVEASGLAIGLGADQTTRLDLERPSQRCSNSTASPRPDIDKAVGKTYPVEATECAANTSSEFEQELHGAKISSSTTCRARDNRLSAVATTAGFDASRLPSGGEAAPPVKVADATTETQTYRDPVRGVVVRVEATVRGIEIPLPEGTGAPLRISMARTVVETWSNGRPSAGARVSFERVVCGIGIGPISQGPCYKAQDDEQFRSLVEDLNKRFGGRITVRIPMPDPEMRKGSPGGYVAGIQKDAADLVDDSLLNGDTSQEVPAIEIIRYADSDDAKVRQIVRLAAVRATTTYGIFLLPRFDGFLPGPVPGGPGLGPVFDGPISGPVNGTPVPDGPGERETSDGGGRLAGGPVIFGLRVRPIGKTALGAAVWLALALPFYLGWRREGLIRWFGREAG